MRALDLVRLTSMALDAAAMAVKIGREQPDALFVSRVEVEGPRRDVIEPLPAAKPAGTRKASKPASKQAGKPATEQGSAVDGDSTSGDVLREWWEEFQRRGPDQ